LAAAVAGAGAEPGLAGVVVAVVAAPGWGVDAEAAEEVHARLL